MVTPGFINWGRILDIPRLIKIAKSLDDGALDKDEAIDLLDVICEALLQVRPLVNRFWLRIVIDGVSVSLQELKEHLGNNNDS